MKGKIDANGNLWIERAGRWVQIQCPLQINYCNHACRLWGEPCIWPIGSKTTVMCCGAGREADPGGCWSDYFDSFTDERVGKA